MTIKELKKEIENIDEDRIVRIYDVRSITSVKNCYIIDKKMQGGIIDSDFIGDFIIEIY